MDSDQRYATAVLLFFVVLAAVRARSFAANVPAGWRTYRSPDHGFMVAYPKDFKFHPNSTEAQLSVIPICDEGTVACFEYSGSEYEGTRLEAAGIAVNIVSGARTEKECNKIDTGQFPIKREIINGIDFHYGETGGAAAGSVIGGPAYRTFRNGVCFELALRVATDNTPHDDTGLVVQFDSTKLEVKLRKILHTFRFVDSAGRAKSK
ncbi:MAG: hypothetical protein WBV36_13050 [Terriglobales bacterium]|jgi:hypothetical protein